MNASVVINVRVTPAQLSKIDRMARATKTQRSWVMRELVDRAELLAPAMFVPSDLADGDQTICEQVRQEVSDA